MSDTVVGNPQAIREFASALQQFCHQTRESLNGVRSHLSELGHGEWSDSRYHQYSELFESSAAKISHALDEIEPEHLNILHNLANRLEEILGGH